MSTLEQYQRHLEKFGPECLLETAATELSESEMGQLKAMVDSMQRVYRWKAGRWIERRQGEPRKCLECGLDLPAAASSQMLRHGHCADKAAKKRHKQRQALHLASGAIPRSSAREVSSQADLTAKAPAEPPKAA